MFKFENREKIFYAALFLGLLAVCFSQGFRYYPFADDYNQYGVYYRRMLEGGAWDNVIMWYRRFSDRPLSFFTDVYLISPFFDNLGVVLLFTLVLHFLTGLMIKDIFKKSGVNFSLIALTVFLLCPLLYESVYWISASSRIIVGMFLSVASLWSFMKILTGTYKPRLFTAGFILFNLLSVGFYEQVILFMVCFHLVLLYLNKEKLKGFSKKALIFVPLINTVIIGVYYLLFSLSGDTDRSRLVTAGFFNHAVYTTQRIISIFTKANTSVFSGGTRYALSNPEVLIFPAIAGVAIICAGFFIFSGKNVDRIHIDGRKQPTAKVIVLSAALSIVPYAVFFVLQNSYVAARSVYPSFVGLALLAGFLFDLLLSKKKRVIPLIAGFLAVLFLVPFTGIVAGYKTCYERNEAISESFLKAFSNGGYTEASGEDKIVVLNAHSAYDDLAIPLESVLESQWRIQGILNAKRGESAPRFTNISVIPPGEKFIEDCNILFFSSGYEIFEVSINDNKIYRNSDKLLVGDIRDGIFVPLI